MVRLLGARDELLKLIEAAFGTSILVRGNEIVISGETTETERVSKLFEELLELLDQGHVLTTENVSRSIEIIKSRDGEKRRPSEVLGDTVVVTHTGKPIRPKTAGQKGYVDSIREHTIVFGIGPAGSGKTYLVFFIYIMALR